MVNKIRAMYPSANITPIDYDPSATRVNQENRIKLMLAVAKERLNALPRQKPLTAEEIAGGAPSLPRLRNHRRNKEAARYSFSLYCAAFLMRRSAYFL